MRSISLALVTTLVSLVSGAPVSYRHIATLPAIVDGGPVQVMFDPVGGRWYSTTSSGIYWADPGEGALQWQGPLVPGRLHHIELAPELGLAFYGTPDDVRMIELKTGATPKVLFQSRKVGSKAYDPLSKRLYLTEALSSRVLVFSIPGGERLPDIEVPGWTAHSLEASVGRIFLQAEGKSGLYVIDTRTHTVSEWPVEGPLTTPAHVEADPSGRFLFATYDRYVVAIDIATARVIGRIVAPSQAAIAWDPAAQRLLVNFRNDDEQPRVRLQVYRIEADTVTLEQELENPAAGAVGLEPATNGFLQRGHRDWLWWKVDD
jgi:DNA-binding beta-propeller fold protein YncE